MTRFRHSVADAPPGNWVDRRAPDWLKPLARLARWDRPIGAWLLFWPCAWSAALAGIAGGLMPSLWHIAFFLIGSAAMRGAGCTWNDIVDREIDARVTRTAGRPLPAGHITTRGALAFLAVQLVVGILVLAQFNALTIILGITSVVPVITYPYMKRITFWPQINLGICFGWGALMGWTAVFAELGAPAMLLYLGAICWIIGYDTIYALQDIEDDTLAGVGSTAILFGSRVKYWLCGFYAVAVVCFALALALAEGDALSFAALAAFALHLAWQIVKLDPTNGSLCLSLFKSNSRAGLILFAGLAIEAVVRAG